MRKNVVRQFGATVRRLRVKSGYSQRAFGEVCGMHGSYIGHVERAEKDISLSNLARIAEGLDMPLSQLMREVERTQAGGRRKR